MQGKQVHQKNDLHLLRFCSPVNYDLHLSLVANKKKRVVRAIACFSWPLLQPFFSTKMENFTARPWHSFFRIPSLSLPRNPSLDLSVCITCISVLSSNKMRNFFDIKHWHHLLPEFGRNACAQIAAFHKVFSPSPHRLWTSFNLSTDLHIPLQVQSNEATQMLPAWAFHSQSAAKVFCFK